MASISSTTCPRSDASDTLAAIRTISSSTIHQGVGFQVERRTAPKGEASGPVCNSEWKRKASKRHQMRCTVLTFRPANSLEADGAVLPLGKRPNKNRRILP